MFNFGTAEKILADLVGVPEGNGSRFRAKLKQLQRMGFPDAINVGRSTNAAYGPVQIFQLAIALELIQLGLTPERATANVRRWWDTFRSAIISVPNRGSPVAIFLLPADASSLAHGANQADGANPWASYGVMVVSLDAADDPNRGNDAIDGLLTLTSLPRTLGISISTLVQNLRDHCEKAGLDWPAFWREVEKWSEDKDVFGQKLSRYINNASNS